MAEVQITPSTINWFVLPLLIAKAIHFTHLVSIVILIC
jgi:hypothetical protein